MKNFSWILFYLIIETNRLSLTSTKFENITSHNLVLRPDILSKFRPYVSVTSCHNTGGCQLVIQYLIITGQRTLFKNKSNVVWKSWVQHVCPPNRVLFITDGPLIESLPFPSYVAYNISVNTTAKDHYRMSQLKWMFGILNSSSILPVEPYDWLVLVDDDTFVIHSSLQDLLHEYSPEEPILIGKRGADCHFMCGGAGLAMSYKLVQNLVSVSSSLEASFLHGVGKDRKIYSDVVLTHVIRSLKLGKLIGRTEFKNFSPEVALKWYTRMGLPPSLVVSFHHIDSEVEYLQIYSHYYRQSPRCLL